MDQLSNAFIEQDPGARSEKEEVERERPACSGHPEQVLDPITARLGCGLTAGVHEGAELGRKA